MAIEVLDVFYSDECTDISSWVDADGGDGVSSQVTFDGQSTFKFAQGGAGGNPAYRHKDIGDYYDRTVIEIKLYHSALGTNSDNDHFSFVAYRADVLLAARFCSDGLFIHDGVSYNLVGSTVSTGTWQTWVFDIDFSTPATATTDVYLDGVLQANDFDCSLTGVNPEGRTELAQNGQTTANRLSYVDRLIMGRDLAETVTSASGTRDALIEGKSYDDLDAVLRGAVTDDVSAIMRSVIASYRGSVVRGYVPSKISAVLLGVTSDDADAAVSGVIMSSRSAILLPGMMLEISSIIQGKPFSDVSAILDSFIHGYREAITRGSIFNNIKGLIAGVAQTYNIRDAILKGVAWSDIKGIIKGKGLDVKALTRGVTWSDVKSIIRGSTWSARDAIEEGKPYIDRTSIIEGHLIQADLTFRYNINKASFDYYYALTDMSSTYRTTADVVLYEENSRPLYIYYGSGHEAYEYYPNNDSLVPAYSNVPADSEWEIKVYANDIDNREERSKVIKELEEVDFDAEIRKAFSKIVDQSYHTFRINFGISGAGSEIYAIMRVRATADRRSWILGKDYPVYLIATDFGLYYLQTTTRWVKIAEARYAIIRGLVYPYALRYGVVKGVTWIDDLLGCILGTIQNTKYGITSGVKFDEVAGIIEGS